MKRDVKSIISKRAREWGAPRAFDLAATRQIAESRSQNGESQIVVPKRVGFRSGQARSLSCGSILKRP